MLIFDEFINESEQHFSALCCKGEEKKEKESESEWVSEWSMYVAM